MHPLAGPGHPTVGQVDAELADQHGPPLAAGTPTGDPDPGQQLLHAERLGGALLEALVVAGGRVVRQADLLHGVWGPGYSDESHYLRTYVGTLRKKLEVDPSRPRHLLTEPGVGYRFE